jgi:transcriptional regulator with XRE-family HTH domain
MTNEQDIKNILGKRIRQTRKKLGLTQGKFGESLGCGRSNISQIENGLFFPTSSFLADIKSNFNVSLDWLFSGVGSMFIEEKEENLDLLDFKEYSNDIKTMLQEMKNSKYIMHLVLAEFFEIKLKKNPSILELKKKTREKKIMKRGKNGK